MIPTARQEKLLVQTVGDELVVYDQERHRVHQLNPTAAVIWRHCDGHTTVAEMAALLSDKQAGPPMPAGVSAGKANEEVVWLALERLDKARLLQERVTRPTDVPDLARRRLMQRMALAGGLALLLPTVSSMTAPTPAMAQSLEGGPGGGGGGGGGGSDEALIAAGAAGAAALAGSAGGGAGAILLADNECSARVPDANGNCGGGPCASGGKCRRSTSNPNRCECY